jgi:hypothetical protein
MIIEDLNVGDFFGTAIILSFWVSFTIVLFEGLGIFRDVWKDDEKKNFFHHHFHYKAR